MEITIFKKMENAVSILLRQTDIRQFPLVSLKRISGSRMNAHIATLKIIIPIDMKKFIMVLREGLLGFFSRKDSRGKGVQAKSIKESEFQRLKDSDTLIL
jgi:hypothetical protein